MLLTIFAGTMTTLATGQQPAPGQRGMAIEIAAQAGGMAQFGLETRVTRGAPYSGEAVTEFVQTLVDGNRIVRRSTTRVYRDGDGRTRRETVSEAAGGAEMDSVIITDPVAGSSVVLDPATRTAHRAPAMFAKVDGGNIAVAGGMRQYSSARVAGGDPAGEPAATRIVVPEGAGERTMTFRAPPERISRGAEAKEDLGQQTIEGVVANGTRTTTTIPAGAVGNEQPITIVSEQWFSPDLRVLVFTRHSDPRVGETTYRLTNISRAEPDRALFQAPADYTLKEPPPMLRRSPVPPPPPPPPPPPSDA
jgi:hypothetical protein